MSDTDDPFALRWNVLPAKIEGAYCEAERHAGERQPAVWCHLITAPEFDAAGLLVVLQRPWLSCEDCRALMEQTK